jgi:hypothetical protein
MKKTLIVVLLSLMAAYTFAEFQIGPYVSYKYPINKGDIPTLSTIGLEDFWFGADARLKLSIFQGTAQALYIPGAADTLPSSFAVNLTAGLAFDLFMLRVGIGVGPALLINFGMENVDTADLGFVGRLNCDLMLGKLALSLIFNTQLNVTGEGEIFDYNNFAFTTGLSLLFKLG